MAKEGWVVYYTPNLMFEIYDAYKAVVANLLGLSVIQICML